MVEYLIFDYNYFSTATGATSYQKENQGQVKLERVMIIFRLQQIMMMFKINLDPRDLLLLSN